MVSQGLDYLRNERYQLGHPEIDKPHAAVACAIIRMAEAETNVEVNRRPKTGAVPAFREGKAFSS